MPIVIDLLSSPDLPPQLAASKLSTTKSTTAPPSTKVSAYQPSKANDDWFILSSDDNLRLPPAKAPVKKITSTSAKPTSLSDATKAVPPNKPLKGGNDFYFLSDDFDSTVHLDDPFASDSPPPKKRRISSSPQAKPSKRMVPKAAGYKRSISNIESSSKTSLKRSAASLSKPKTTRTVLESDPIQFTSSPDPVGDAERRRKEKRMQILDEDDEEDIFGLEPVQYDKSVKDIKESSNDKVYKGYTFDDLYDSSDDELPHISSLPSKFTSKPSTSSQSALAKYNADKAKEKAAKEKAEKMKDKAEKSKEKAASKEAEKEQKRLAKEEKAREKGKAAELAKVNTLRTDKKISTPEMIVDLPSSLNSKLSNQVQNFLRPLDVEYSEWESDLPIIKWRRKVNSEYNNELDLWQLTECHIKPEKHVLCVIPAQEFVDLVTRQGQELDIHILRLKTQFESCEIIYLIEGLVAWMRKNRNLKNRQFTEAVRSHLGQEEPNASQRARKKKEQEYINEDLIEDALLRLQVIHNAYIHHTGAMIETAEWVLTFTQHISTIPYRTQKYSLDTSFCMETGQVKTGDNTADTFVKMLQEIIRITAPIAYGIAAEYPTVQKLVKGLEKHGPLALENCRKSANKDGAFTDRRVGPAISKRVYSLFMGKDPGSWDV